MALASRVIATLRWPRRCVRSYGCCIGVHPGSSRRFMPQPNVATRMVTYVAMPADLSFATLLVMTQMRAYEAPNRKRAMALRNGWRNGGERKALRGMAEANEGHEAFRASCVILIPKGSQPASDCGYSGMPRPLKAETRCRVSRLRQVWFSSLTATAKGGRGDNHQNSAQA